MGILVAVIPAMILLYSINNDKSKLTNEVETELTKSSNEHISSLVKEIVKMLDSQQEILVQVVASNLRVIENVVEKKGGIKLLSDTVSWKSVNQLTKESSEINLPKMTLASSFFNPDEGWLGQNYDTGIKTPVVDEAIKLVGGEFTIFQKMNAGGDMIRIATTVRTKDNKRAIGTYIPAANPDGSKNNIISDIMQGKTYVGRAFVVDAWYIAAYSPMKDRSGEIIGMCFAGIKQESSAKVRQSIMKTIVGKTGYMFVLGGKGDQKGRYIISKEGKRDGENIWDSKDTNGQNFIQDMIAGAMEKSKNGEIHFQRYQWKNGGEDKAKEKIAACIYFEPWDWVIGAGTYTEELNATMTSVNETLSEFNNKIMYIGVASLAAAIILALLIGGGVSSNIRELVVENARLSKGVADGDLSVRGDAACVSFEFAPIISGINGVMEAFITPLKMSSDHISRIAAGDIPEKITKEFKGEFNDTKNNLNQCIDTINSLVKETAMLSGSAVEGKLYTRADASKHQGDFKKIVEGVNDTIDSLVKLIDNFPAPLTIVNKNFEILFMNKAGSSLNDTSGEKLLTSKTKCYEFFKAGDCQNSNCAVAKAMQTGSDASRETDAHPGCHNLDISYTGVPIKNKEGLVIGAFEIVTDLTAIKRSQRTAQKIADFQETETGKITDALNKLAQGDLNVNIEVAASDIDTIDAKKKFDVIKSAIDAAIDSINDILSQVSTSVDQVNTGSRQVSDASQALSQGATESASSLEEIGSSMHQINSQIEKTAANSMEANNLAGSVRKSAESGSDKMSRMTSAMNDINESSSNISKIIKSIDEIAFQTNLLALNAAVEAARAGKHGKGFTVVAEEVRNLAQRSAKAAKETADMIENSRKKAEDGTKIADETARSLNEIVSGIARVGDIIGEIAAASKEEALGIQHINKGLSQVDQVTQQNTATAEESAAASEELSAQAVELKGMLEKFKLKNSGAGTTVNAYIKKPQAGKNFEEKTAIKQIQQQQASAKKPEGNGANKKPAVSGGSPGKINPADIISLDDNEFGKF